MEQADKDQSVKQLISSIAAVDEDKFALYLWLIEAPQNLEGLLQVTSQLSKIIQIIKYICELENVEEFLSKEEIDECELVAAAIISSKVIIEKEYPPANTKLLNKKPFHGLFTHNYIYTCLGKSCLDGDDSSRHLLLEAYLVVASGILRHRKEHASHWRDPKEYLEALDDSCRLTRKLLLPTKIDIHNNLPQQLSNAHGEYLKGIQRSGNTLKCIYNLLDYALSGKSAPTYLKSGHTRKLRTIRHTINDAVDPELIGKTDDVEMWQLTAELACGLDAPETSGGVDYYQISSPLDDKLPSEQHNRKKRNYLSSIAMHNQRLPFRWEMLSLYEVSCFIETIEQLASGVYQYNTNIRGLGEIDQRELAAVAVTLFLRSVPINDLPSIKLSDAAYAQVEPPGYRFYSYKSGVWVVSPPTLPMDMNLDKTFYGSAELRREFYFVRSGTGLEQIIDTYITEVRKKEIKKRDESERNLFLKSPYYYEQALQKIISRLNEQHKTRLTLKRIECFLHNYLAGTDGADLTTAMLLTGRNDFLGMPPLHYTALPVKRLQAIYYISCRKLMSGIGQELTAQGKVSSLCNIQDDSNYAGSWRGMAGTSYRPKRKAVRKMIRRLQERIRHIQSMECDRNKLLRLHNNIMQYTAIMFAFSTGFRAVRSPLLPPSQIDDTTGFAVISDKDGIDYYNSRIVWLPPVCIQQYYAYLKHLECLMPKLEYLDLDAFNALRHLLSHPRPNDKIPLFFFLRMDGGSCVLKPTDIWSEIRKNLQYDLPSNASRHYLRSHLTEKGCPPELVAAFMGHWERGEEPWGSFSALPPIQYAETIASYLIPMLEEDGWTPITGMQDYW